MNANTIYSILSLCFDHEKQMLAPTSRLFNKLSTKKLRGLEFAKSVIESGNLELLKQTSMKYVEENDLLKFAAINGQSEIYKFLVSYVSHTVTYRLINGKLKFLRSQHRGVFNYYLKEVIASKNIELIKFILDNFYCENEHFIISGIRTGDIEIVNLLLSYRFEKSEYSIYEAFVGCDLEMLKFLIEEDFPKNLDMLKHFDNYDNKEIIEYAVSCGFEAPDKIDQIEVDNIDDIAYHATKGNISTIKKLLSKGHEKFEIAILNAVFNDQIDTVIFLVNEGFFKNGSAFDYAIEKENIFMIETLIKCDFPKTRMAIDYATEKQNLQILHLLHRNGFPKSISAIEYACMKGNIELYELFIFYEYPKTANCLNNICANNHVELLELFLKTGYSKTVLDIRNMVLTRTVFHILLDYGFKFNSDIIEFRENRNYFC